MTRRSLCGEADAGTFRILPQPAQVALKVVEGLGHAGDESRWDINYLSYGS